MDCFRRIIRFFSDLKEAFYDAILEKLYIKSIFALEEIPQFALTNQKKLAKLNNNEKNDLIKGLEYISQYNRDFTKLRTEYIISSEDAVNFSSFQHFIRTEESGFYLKRAKLHFIFRVVLVLLQLLILINYYPKHFCVNELIDDKSIDDDTMFWIYDNQKYKVKKGYNELLFYLSLTSFILDLILIISESIVL